jgi:hypothetical protein
MCLMSVMTPMEFSRAAYSADHSALFRRNIRNFVPLFFVEYFYAMFVHVWSKKNSAHQGKQNDQDCWDILTWWLYKDLETAFDHCHDCIGCVGGLDMLKVINVWQLESYF